MARKMVFFVFLPAILCLITDRASAQANVTENQTTSIYVDAKAGSDSNSGAQSTPLKTIQAAIDKADTDNQKGIGVRVIVNPGVYRETVSIGSYKSTTAVLTVQAATTGTAIVAGSDVISNWGNAGSGIYTHVWTENMGWCSVPSGWPTTFAKIALRTEMVFVNGTPLTQVMSHTDLRPGTFFVSDAGSMMYIDPPPSVNMSSATVEAAVRPNTLMISNRSNIVIRGLVFRHAATCINQTGANVFGSTNVLIDSLQALWNNWGGLGIYTSSKLTVQNSVSSHNGGLGFMGAQDQNVLFSFDESDYNNWRGSQAALFDWGMGGTKLMFMRNTTVQNHFSYNNQAQGLWFDTDNKNITVNNATLSGNVMSALQLEANEGPITVENSHICSSGAGINILNTEGLTIKNNILYNNGGTGIYDGAEIFVAGIAGGHKITDWLTGQAYNLFTAGTVFTGNTSLNAAAGQRVFGTYLGGNDWSQFANSLNASSNKWYDPSLASSFMIPSGKLVNLQGWQSTVTTDYNSTWTQPSASPAAACTAPAATFTDFSLGLDRESYSMSAGKATARLRVNSFGYGTVTLAISGLPAGVSATLSSQSLVSGAVTVTFSASASAAAKVVPITIWASSGARVHYMTFNVSVTPA
jgi:hypothetical protein